MAQRRSPEGRRAGADPRSSTVVLALALALLAPASPAAAGDVRAPAVPPAAAGARPGTGDAPPAEVSEPPILLAPLPGETAPPVAITRSASPRATAGAGVPPELVATAAPAAATASPEPAGRIPTLVRAPRAPALFVPRTGGTPGDRPVPELDGFGAVRYALAHEPQLLTGRASIQSAQLAYDRARAGEYPALAGTLSNTLQKSSNLSGSLAQFGVTPQSRFSQNTAQLAATWNAYNGAATLAAEQARRQVNAAEYDLVRLQEQSVVAVAGAFYQLAALHEIVLVDESDLSYQRSLLGIARANEHVGRIAGVDVLRAEVAATRSEAALISARTDESNAREALAVQIGAPSDTAFRIPQPLPEPPAPAADAGALDAVAVANRPEIFEAIASYDASKLGDAQVDDDLRPVVALSGAFGSQVSPTSLVLQQQQIDAANAQAQATYALENTIMPGAFPVPAPLGPVDRHQPGFWQFAVTSSFNIPLYDYGVRAAAHHAARAQIDASLAQLDDAYDVVRSDVDADRRTLVAAAQRLGLAKASAGLATESARVAQLQYRSGLISFTDVTQTQNVSLAAQNDLVAARVAYVTAYVRLRESLAPADPAAAADVR